MKRIGQLKWGVGILPLTGFLVAMSAALFLACGGYASQASADMGAESNLDDVTYLDQYGSWIDIEPYGSVWQPSVSADWRPFSYGHWVWTDAGWAWVSYEPYGWLVYHYGNWDYDPDFGWFWIEGNDWSPAQVQWLNYDGYCSWAPLPPAGVEWSDPWDEGGFRYWIAVRDRDFDRDNIGHHRIGRPPLPRDQDRRDVVHQPIGIHDFEKITGRNVKPEILKHGPAPVYMHPRQPMQHHEMQMGEVRHEQRPPDQMTQHPAEGSQMLSGRPESRPAGDRSGETTPAEPRQAETRPAQGHTGESQPAENRPAEAHIAENQPQRAIPPDVNPAENRPEVTQPVQLHRMILPKSEEDRVKKYRPRVEREVLVPKNRNNQAPRKEAGNKNKK
jgi:hypothetical protein